jgi:hypothetical protein
MFQYLEIFFYITINGKRCTRRFVLRHGLNWRNWPRISRKLSRTTVLRASSRVSPIQLSLPGTVLRSWPVARVPKRSGSGGQFLQQRSGVLPGPDRSGPRATGPRRNTVPGRLNWIGLTLELAQRTVVRLNLREILGQFLQFIPCLKTNLRVHLFPLIVM